MNKQSGNIVRENKWKIKDLDKSSSSPQYFSFTDEIGNWYIMRQRNVSVGIKTYDYYQATYTIKGAYDTKWSNRANLSYGDWDFSF